MTADWLIMGRTATRVKAALPGRPNGIGLRGGINACPKGRQAAPRPPAADRQWPWPSGAKDFCQPIIRVQSVWSCGPSRFW